jgi:hypothetical protein
MKKLLIGLGVLFLILFAFFIVFFGFAFFNASKMMPSVEKFIDNFYRHSNSQDYGYIYNVMTDQKFKSVTSGGSFERLMRTVELKLGGVKERKKSSWKLNYTTGGVLFSVQYNTLRDRAKAVESFVLKKKNGSWLLLNYNINSDALF